MGCPANCRGCTGSRQRTAMGHPRDGSRNCTWAPTECPHQLRLALGPLPRPKMQERSPVGKLPHALRCLPQTAHMSQTGTALLDCSWHTLSQSTIYSAICPIPYGVTFSCHSRFLPDM